MDCPHPSNHIYLIQDCTTPGHIIKLQATTMHRIIIYLLIGLVLSACDSNRLRTSGTDSDARNSRIARQRNQGTIESRNEAERSLSRRQRSDDPGTAPGDAKKAQESGNVWERIRDNLALERNINDNVVQDKIRWYAKNQEYLDRVNGRATLYLYYITEELLKRNMPLDLALLPIVESAYNPFAYSRSRASGLWQFIPSTGKRYGLKQNWWYDGRRDVIEGTKAALDYLEKLNAEFDGDWLLTLAAYNTGERNVARAVERNRNAGKKTDFWSLRLHRETHAYVPSLLAVAEILAKPEKYGIQWQPIPDVPYFTVIDTGSQIDLATAAELAGMSMDELYLLNPGFNQWATDPEGPHRILVTADRQGVFLDKLSSLTDSERMRWDRHLIQRGETLGQIADQYRTSVAALKQVNELRSNLIHEGSSLLIPLSKQPKSHYTLSLDSRGFAELEESGTGEEHLYTIRRGDTLWDISHKYGVTVAKLTSWNGIRTDSVLRLGQKLKLWANQIDGTTIANAADQKTSQSSALLPESRKLKFTYTVRSGDSLWLIARRNNITVDKLTNWNNMGRNATLRPGQILKLQPDVATKNPPAATLTAAIEESGIGMDANYSAPVNYIVKKGDSLWIISKRFGITVAQLRKWNNLNEDNQIQPGQRLILYTREA